MKTVCRRVHWHLAGLGTYIFIVIIATCVNVAQGEYGSAVGEWSIDFGTTGSELRLNSKSNVYTDLTIDNVDLSTDVDFYFDVKVADAKIALVEQRIWRNDLSALNAVGKWQGVVRVAGQHFGYTQLYVELHATTSAVERSLETLNVAVTRAERLRDEIFTYTASALVLIMFLNLGTALDLKRLKQILYKPIGPFIGFCTRFLLMPALGLGLGYLFFPENKGLQLALFFTALSPSGGLANISTIFLKGNINLSLATTTINALLSIAMLPLWVFTLVRVIYDVPTLSVPFVDLGVGTVALIAVVTLGIILRTFIPKTTKFIFRFLKPLSVFLTLCLIALTVTINAFIFKEITLMIALAAIFLPLLGYIVSFVFAKIFCRSEVDSLTIAVETSVLNMTAPIILLQHSLGDPKADMIIVVPITASLMSLCMIFIFYVVRRIFGWNKRSDEHGFDTKDYTTFA